MKLSVFCTNGESETRLGIVDAAEGTVRQIAMDCGSAGWGHPALAGLSASDLGNLPIDRYVPLSDVRLSAPIPRPRRNIFCVGKNYHEHAKEFADSGFDSSAAAGAIPKMPIIFSKVPECVVATHEDIVFDPAFSTAIDYEAELAVVIGKGGSRITREQAMSHVWGYTILNDVTARDVQARHSQWLLGKSADTFAPMGPWMVTADELGTAALTLTCWVNGEVRQRAETDRLIFDIPTLIETISAGTTLEPGDIIATGTPAGVGIGFTPPRYLRHGDRVRIEISKIGVLENVVRDSSVPIIATNGGTASSARAS
jgi:2-keto-4-pentenoate hydratase/2-oxohepta-3-ene-1,7-dioic acid hydratase in catechol pathway